MAWYLVELVDFNFTLEQSHWTEWE